MSGSNYVVVDNTDRPEVVGVNGIGEITFEDSADQKPIVKQIVHWVQPGNHEPALTTYTVRLDLNAKNDKEFPDILPPKENQP